MPSTPLNIRLQKVYSLVLYPKIRFSSLEGALHRRKRWPILMRGPKTPKALLYSLILYHLPTKPNTFVQSLCIPRKLLINLLLKSHCGGKECFVYIESSILVFVDRASNSATFFSGGESVPKRSAMVGHTHQTANAQNSPH